MNLKELETQNFTKGEILKKVREERGLSLESVHEATKIPLDALGAIEEGYTVRTLSPFYYRGFVKIYATYLELNPDDFVEPNQVERPAPEKIPGEIERFEWRDVLPRLTRYQKKQLVSIGIALVGFFLFFKLIGFLFFRGGEKKEKPAKKVNIEKVKAAVKKEKRKEEKKSQPAARTANPQAVVRTATATPPVKRQQTVAKNVTLTVRATKKSWLRVKADGSTVFQSTLRKGAVETWSANESIEISGRNVGQLEFELNGEMIGALSRKDRQAKEIIITPDGLTVTK